MANEIEIVIVTRDRSGPGFDTAERRMRNLGSTAHASLGQASQSTLKLGNVLNQLGGIAGGVAGVVSTVLSGALRGVVELASFAFQKVVDFASQSVAASSNLGESINAVQKIFKGSSDQILQWGKDNAASFGLSRRAFNELATPLGALLKNAGLSLNTVTTDTIELTKRAADMASVFNTDVSDALMAIQAGLRGETDPLERYGVHLSAAAVEAEALKETHKKLASSLTETELATARVNLIMRQTADTAGDFASTSGGLANSTRIAAARLEDLQAKVGDKLVPVMIKWNEIKLKLIDTMSQKLIPVLDRVWEKIKAVWEVIGPVLGSALERLKKTWEDNREELEKFGKFCEEVLIPILGGSLLIAILGTIEAFRLMIVFAAKVGEAWDRTKKDAQFLIDVLTVVREVAGAIWDIMIGRTDEAINRIRRLKAELGQGSIRAEGAALSSSVVVSSGIGHRAAGGIAGGLTWVADRGAELLDLPQGTMVYPNANTNQMLGGAGRATGGGSYVEIGFVGNTDSALALALKKLFDAGLVTIRAKHVVG
jgi:hypothetical protein